METPEDEHEKGDSAVDPFTGEEIERADGQATFEDTDDAPPVRVQNDEITDDMTEEEALDPDYTAPNPIATSGEIIGARDSYIQIRTKLLNDLSEYRDQLKSLESHLDKNEEEAARCEGVTEVMYNDTLSQVEQTRNLLDQILGGEN